MKEKKAFHLRPKWLLFALLFAVSLCLIFIFPGGYTMSGLFLLGLAALIPIYHWLKFRRKLRMVFSCLLFLLILAMVLTLIPIVGASFGTGNTESEYLVVLGAGVHGTVPSRSLRERLDAAYDFLVNHPENIAIVSGGQGSGEDITEAQCMYDYLVRRGISPERIWMEDKATSTLENLQYSLDLIESRTGIRPGKIAVLSSEYHLYRAGIFAGWLNLEAELVPAKTTYITIRTNYYLREIFAVWYYTIFGG